MSLRYLRKILAISLCVFIAIGSVGVFSTVIIKSTICEESYMARFINSSDISSARKDAFNKKIEVLEAKSGIPARVFDAVYNFGELTDDTALHRVYSGFDSGLYNEAIVGRFEELCKEYLDGTGAQYDEDLVSNTADEAARIYADCFGLKQVSEFSSFVKSFERNFQMLVSIFVILVMLPVTLIFLMFKKGTAILINVLPGFIAAGMTMFVTGVIGAIFKIGQKTLITPYAYAVAAANAVKGLFIITILAGAVLAICCLILHIYVIEKSRDYN